jgi:hypothetical protein
MAYIGNQPLTAAFLTDTFSGNGSTVAFTMTVAPANSSSIIVAVTGVLQDPSTYSVSGTTLTFSAAPPTGTNNISVRYLGLPASGVVTTAYRTVTEFTATASQTTFSVPSYTVGYVDVYRNGVMLGSADYTATSGTTIVLASGATAGDLVEVISFYVSSVLNAIPGTAGSVGTTYLADAGVTPAKLSTGAPSWDSSGNLSFNSGYGSTAVAYGCRAWVNFNGTGTVAIRASGNVTSITDNGTGLYSVNFANAMPDANYAAVIATEESGIICTTSSNNAFQQTASVGRVGVYLGTSASGYDADQVNYAVFR